MVPARSIPRLCGRGSASTVQKALQSLDEKTFWICTRAIISSSIPCLLSGSGEKESSDLITLVGVTPGSVMDWTISDEPFQKCSAGA